MRLIAAALVACGESTVGSYTPTECVITYLEPEECIALLRCECDPVRFCVTQVAGEAFLWYASYDTGVFPCDGFDCSDAAVAITVAVCGRR